MRLRKIIEGMDIRSVKNFKNYNISTITHISSDVVAGSIFVCIRGNNFDGNDFIKDAISNGAKCVVTDNVDASYAEIVVIVVSDVRIAMSVMAKNFYNRCVDTLRVVGVVGTSGKTTTTLMLSQLLSSSGKKIGVIGTNGIFIDNIRQANNFTTPDPLDLHYIFYQMKMLGVDIVIMEVSAQAIYYNKVHGIHFDICVFTNISREHLDFFGSMENYVKTKMNFFRSCNMDECVVNIDDFYGRELAYKTDMPCVSFGLKEPANSFAIDMNYELDKTQFVANILDDVFDIDFPFVGVFNVYNLLASLTVAKMLGLTGNELKHAIKKLSPIDGRFNVIHHGKKKVIIDFAHTPESISLLLGHIKRYAKSRILSVFGCVGYSNQEKRIEMADVVSMYSDYIVVTSDNPGTTSFESICEDIKLGLGNKNYICIEDRYDAIRHAYNLMKDDDILVLIGKGAENFQKIGEEKIPYSDRESIVKILESEI